MRNTILGILLVILSVVPSEAGKVKSYTYTRVGSTADSHATPLGGTVLMGGGTDVDAAFEWMCAQSGNGDFLIIRTTGTDAYNPYVRQLCPNGNSVATLIVPTVAGANDPFVVATMNDAEAIWIAGGDQSTYVTNWKGTSLQTALNDAIARGVPVGGTSAGMMVLTQFIYSALLPQGVTSSQALADPYNKYITLDRDLFNVTVLRDTIGDSHFVTRDRMGRTLAFMCRLAAADWSVYPRAIAIDEQTALEIDGDGVATVVGYGAAYFLLATGGKAEVCTKGSPLTYQNIAVHKAVPGQTFALGSWSSADVSYWVNAVAGVLTSTAPGGSIY